MAVRITSEVLQEGEYLAILTHLKDDVIEFTDRDTNKDTERNVIRFYFALDGEDAGVQELEAVAWTAKFSELSKAGEYARELMGWSRLPKGTWDDGQLIGRPCYVRVKVQTNQDGNKFLKIAGIRSVPTAIATNANIRSSIANLRDYAGLDKEPAGEEAGRNAGEPAADDIDDLPF